MTLSLNATTAITNAATTLLTNNESSFNNAIDEADAHATKTTTGGVIDVVDLRGSNSNSFEQAVKEKRESNSNSFEQWG